jgi:hypothetical protein
MSAGAVTTRALLGCAILMGMSSTACIASEKKHDIQGLELGMPRHDALEKLRSMSCADITAGNAFRPDFVKSFQCPNINFDIIFSEWLAGFPLRQIQAKFQGILTTEEQKRSIEQQYDVVLSRQEFMFLGSLGQDRTINFMNNDTMNGQTTHDWLLTITDEKLRQDDRQAEQESTRQKFSAPQKF